MNWPKPSPQFCGLVRVGCNIILHSEQGARDADSRYARLGWVLALRAFQCLRLDGGLGRSVKLMADINRTGSVPSSLS